MNPRGTFERVYDAIRHRLEAAQFAPGDHLEPSHLAEQFNSSITPVRDALQRLVGERLIEASPGEGFRMPVFTEVGLRQLYEWNGQLLQLALKGTGDVPGEEERAAEPLEKDPLLLADRASRLFAAVAGRSGNGELQAAVQALNIRLSLVRCREARLIKNASGELRAIEQFHVLNDIAGLRRALYSYHRRRQGIADRLVIAVKPS